MRLEDRSRVLEKSSFGGEHHGILYLITSEDYPKSTNIKSLNGDDKTTTIIIIVLCTVIVKPSRETLRTRTPKLATDH
jgi:hypothetical protein